MHGMWMERSLDDVTAFCQIRNYAVPIPARLFPCNLENTVSFAYKVQSEHKRKLG